jgi:SAM-dependent methyltransferase
MYYLNNETSVYRDPIELLHFAPERAIESNLKKLKNLNYITADINPAFADYEIDIQDIPFHDNKFHIIICSHVLGHIPNEAKAIDEIYRVLKPGGFALILTLIDFNRANTYESTEIDSNEKRLEQYGEPDLLRLHGNDFAIRLNRENIDVEIIEYFKSFSVEERQKYQLGTGERELIFKCIKTK